MTAAIALFFALYVVLALVAGTINSLTGLGHTGLNLAVTISVAVMVARWVKAKGAAGVVAIALSAALASIGHWWLLAQLAGVTALTWPWELGVSALVNGVAAGVAFALAKGRSGVAIQGKNG